MGKEKKMAEQITDLSSAELKTKRNIKYNIEYTEIPAENLTGLNNEQGTTMTQQMTALCKRLAEAEFLLASYENNWDIPNNIPTEYK